MFLVKFKWDLNFWSTAGPGWLWDDQGEPAGFQVGAGWNLCGVWHQCPGGEAGAKRPTSPQNARQHPRATGAAFAGCCSKNVKTSDFWVVSDIKCSSLGHIEWNFCTCIVAGFLKIASIYSTDSRKCHKH